MNAAQKNVYEFQMERFEAFKAQNSEDGDFDVIFEIDGKKLYAHKFMLSLISPSFKSMLSKRWTKPDEHVKIEGYTFDDFKELLTFIYSGECKYTDDNIFAMVDMAEFYGIQAMKKECEIYLPGILTAENVYQMIELVDKYSLDEFKKSVNEFISNDLAMFCTSPQFQYLQKSIVHDVVKANHETFWQEELFEGVYKWSENQATEKQKSDQCLDLKEIIKEELSDILPLIKFEKMEQSFLIKFVVRKSFLFSDDQLNDILFARGKLYVKVIGENGKLMKGKLQCGDNESVANVIQSVKNQSCADYDADYCFWFTAQPEPSLPNKLIKNDKIEWYLLFDEDGDLVIDRRNDIAESDCLLAEMSAENGFEFSSNCKIEMF